MSNRAKKVIDRLARLATIGVDAALIEAHNELGLMDRQLHELRLGVLSVMPENWREDPDWVALVDAQKLTPNVEGNRLAASKPKMEVTTNDIRVACGQSALTDGLGGVPHPGLSNDELANAIAYAFERCNQQYVGGYTTSNTEPGKAMLEHLKELLKIQRARAGFIETPNDSGERGRACATSARPRGSAANCTEKGTI